MFANLVKAAVAACLFFFATAANNPEKTKVTLTSSNTVVMDSVFSDTSVAKVLLAARELNNELSSGKPIYLVISSPGGSIEAGLELIDNLNALGRTVHTVTLFSASMGFQTVQGVPGTRYITSTGTLMSHKASGGFEGEFPGQVDSRYQYYLRRIGKLDEQTVARSRGLLTLESYRALYENEYWCEGQDCVDKGLADEAVLVACDKSLDGTKESTYAFSFLGRDVEVQLTKAACPTITGVLDQVVNVNGQPVVVDDLDTLSLRYGFTATEASQLKAQVEKHLEEISPSKMLR